MRKIYLQFKNQLAKLADAYENITLSLRRSRLKKKLNLNGQGDLQIFAHRGSKSNRPENTLVAFEEAVRVGADGIELDVHLTRDGEIVVIHDESIDRTSNGHGFVRNLTLSEIQKFDAGSWFDKKYKNEKIPTLKEVLELLKELDFKGILNIEIKTDKYYYPGIEGKVSELMLKENYPFSHIYCSFNYKSLEKLHDLEPDTELAYLAKNEKDRIIRGLDSPFANSLHPRIDWLYKNIDKLDKSEKFFRFWTINNDLDIKIALSSPNVLGIMTDYPERAIKIRNEYKKES